jgi:GT2 family glycosyltransferase
VIRRGDPRLSVIVVTYNEQDVVGACLEALVPQLRPEDELIVADNASRDQTLEVVRRTAPQATILTMESNEGYMPACNRAALHASGDLLLLIDADAVVADGFCERIREPMLNGSGWGTWMGLLTMESGRLINTSGGAVHFTGISWAGQVGQPVTSAPAGSREVGFASGACMAVRADTWRRLGGLPEAFFLYYDDVDLSLRVRLAGERVGIVPEARVDHLYDFTKRRVKWRLLERNRWDTIVRTYPARLLALVMPALIATEVGLLVVALRGGWLREKVGADLDVVRQLPRLLAERRSVQAMRRVGDAEFARHMTAELTSPYLGAAGRSRLLNRALRGYWRLVCRMLAQSTPA